jgi:transposase
LAKRGIPVLSHPPYSHDLAPADFLFPKLKIAMKGTRFEAVSSIQQTVTIELKGKGEGAFSRSLDSLYERCKRFAAVGGDCIE